MLRTFCHVVFGNNGSFMMSTHTPHYTHLIEGGWEGGKGQTWRDESTDQVREMGREKDTIH